MYIPAGHEQRAGAKEDDEGMVKNCERNNEIILIREGQWEYKGYEIIYNYHEEEYYAYNNNEYSKHYATLNGIKRAIDTGKIKIN